jgi:hypothetical protein
MPETLVTVKTLQFLPEAEAAKMHLAEHGIRAFLSDAEVVNMDWLLGNALGYVKLQVASDQAEAAQAALREFTPQRREEDETADAADVADTCLSCGAILPAGQSVCASCGWSYGEGGEEASTGEGADASTSEPDRDTPNVMAGLRRMKRPVLWLFLWPILVVVALVNLWLLSLIFRW